MRNMAFSLTTPQFRAGRKFVTRRFGWDFLEPGMELMGVEKGMGIPKGGLVRIAPIIVISVDRERLIDIVDYPIRRLNPRTFEQAREAFGEALALSEMTLEGFPGERPEQFVERLCDHYSTFPRVQIKRIEYVYKNWPPETQNPPEPTGNRR